MTSRGTKYWNSGTIPLIGPEILGDIISEIADVAVVVAASGDVLSVLVNPEVPAFGRMANLEGADFRSALTTESVAKFDDRLREFLTEGRTRATELNHSQPNGLPDLPIRYSFHNIGPDGSILLLGRDLRAIAEMQQQLVQAQVALERDYELHRKYDTFFSILLETSPDPVLFVSTDTGKITEANQACAVAFGRDKDRVINERLDDVLHLRRKDDVVDTLSALALSDPGVSVEVAVGSAGQEYEVTPTLFRAAGERLMLCRLRSADGSKRPDSLGDQLRDFFRASPDAIVFADAHGRILSANTGFLDLLGAGNDAAVKGADLADFLQRGSVDLRVMTDNASRVGKMRSYVTRIAGDFGSPLTVEIAVTMIEAGDERVFAFLMREHRRNETGRPAAETEKVGQMQSVVELVGSASLKEIVAETTDVVEKMCIETAVELTMNNRVAAAEMLGLSRQSLYVKLRKFGLLNKNG